METKQDIEHISQALSNWEGDDISKKGTILITYEINQQDDTVTRHMHINGNNGKLVTTILLCMDENEDFAKMVCLATEAYKQKQKKQKRWYKWLTYLVQAAYIALFGWCAGMVCVEIIHHTFSASTMLYAVLAVMNGLLFYFNKLTND